MFLALTGDVMLGRLAGRALVKASAEHPWGDVLPLLRQADLRFVNLECVVAESGTPARKVFTFRAPPRAIDALREARIDAVCLANNHVLDYGEQAFVEMLGRLDDARIARVGAGRNRAEAWRPVVLESNGVRVGLLGLTDNEPGWAAGSDRPGVAHMEIRAEGRAYEALLEGVRAASKQCDLLVVTAHWGPNMRREPPETFRRFARGVLGAGADLWWGHSAHLFQGIERHQGKLILYDTGDFVDDYRIDPHERNDLGFLFLVEIWEGTIHGVELVPTKVSPHAARVDRAEGEDREWAQRKMEALCDAFGTPVERTGRGLRVSAHR